MVLGEWYRRIRYLLNRRRLESELQQDMEAHREMMGDPARFGNTLRLREESRDVWGWKWLDDAWLDLRYSARTLRRSPAFAVTACLILSLGIGLNLTFFQMGQPGLVHRPNSGFVLRRHSLDHCRDAVFSFIDEFFPFPQVFFNGLQIGLEVSPGEKNPKVLVLPRLSLKGVGSVLTVLTSSDKSLAN